MSGRDLLRWTQSDLTPACITQSMMGSVVLTTLNLFNPNGDLKKTTGITKYT